MGIFDGVLNVALVLFILVVLVVIHELGHFITARRAGVRVHEFGIGFPPRARIFARDSETIYTLNWLPLGGFVRLEGEDGDSEDPRSFSRQPLRTRLLILLAGVGMNLLLAFVIFWGIAGFADPSSTVRIGFVQPDSPAAAAGLRGGQQTGTTDDGRPIYDDTGDVITAIDGQRLAWFDAPDSILASLRQRPGQTVTLTVRHADGTTEDKTVTLRSAAEGAAEQGALGIQAQALLYGDPVPRDPISAVGVGVTRTVDASTLILRGLGDLIVNIGDPQVSGPIGIVRIVGEVRQELPPVFLVWLVGLLSANLAVVNALPFPPMDGGRIAISLVQRLSGNRISAAAERLVYLTGFILLMALLVWISYFDLARSTPGT